MIYRILVILSALMVSACTNAFQEFYEPVTTSRLLVLSKEEPVELPSSGDASLDFDQMYERGYRLVVHAFFVGKIENRQGALVQAKKIGANRVIIGTKYRNTESGVRSYTTPTTSTAYTSGTVTPSGYGYSGGSARYSGTTTVYGMQTTYVPYSIDRYNQYALYFAPLELKGTGMYIGEPTNDVRRQAGTNKGCMVKGVRRGSPAYHADFIAGDLIIAIGERDLVEPEHCARFTIASDENRIVDVVLYRGAKQLTKRLVVPMRDETW